MIALLLAALLQFPHVAMISAMRGTGEPFVRADGSLDSALCRTQARYDYVTLTSQALGFPQIARYLRLQNPVIHLYVGVQGYNVWNSAMPGQPPRTFDEKRYASVQATDGMLWCRDRRAPNQPAYPCGFWNVDGGNVTTALAYADTVCPWFAGWDGVMMDQWGARTYGNVLSDKDSVDITRMGYTSAKDWNAAWSAGHWAMAARLRSLIPTGTIIGNGGTEGEADQLNGWYLENWPYQGTKPGDDPWYGTMVRNGYNVPGYLWRDSAYVHPTANVLSSLPGGSDADTRRKLRWGLGSATLGDGWFQWCICEWLPLNFRWAPEYSVDDAGHATMDQRYKGWLGDPRSGWFRKVGGANNGTLYCRDFSNGMVIVNPTTSVQSYYGGEIMRSIAAPFPEYRGKQARAFTVPAQDALFLQRPR